MEGQYLNLSFSWLLILPLIAGVLVFQGAWLDDGISARGRPKKYQRRLKAKILIHRALIINLLLATFFVFTSSFTVLPDIVQGLLLTAVMTLPVLIYLLFIVFKWPFKKKLPAGDSVARSELASSIIQSPSYEDLNEMIVSLQKKELKLEKLVITQKAVIDIERQKNQKAQLLTRNAMTLISKAKEGARVAIRVAQQERKERLRLEASNTNKARQLENGPSPTHVKNTVKN